MAEAPLSARFGGILYRRGARQSQLGWFDRSGNLLRPIGQPEWLIEDPCLSPDEKRVAAGHFNFEQGGTDDLRLIDLERGNSSRFTFEASWSAVWSPDGSRLAFAAPKSGSGDLYQKAVSGAEAEELLFKSEFLKFPLDWSRDGQYLLFGTVAPQTKTDLWFLPMKGAGKAQPFFQSPFDEWQATFSPDGSMIAFLNTTNGSPQVWIKNLAQGEPIQITTGNIPAVQPHWSPKNDQIVFSRPGQGIWSVPP